MAQTEFYHVASLSLTHNTELEKLYQAGWKLFSVTIDTNGSKSYLCVFTRL